MMFVLNLCRQLCPEKIPVQPGERLGDGADGEVFIVADEPTKIVKFSIIYDRFEDSPREIYFKKIVPILDYVMLSAPSICAHIYEHGFLGEFSRKMPYWNKGIQKFIIHYCVMDRLYKLSEDERKVFHTLVSHEDREIKKDLSSSKIEKICKGLTKGLDFDAQKVMLFCAQLRNASLLHSDMHPRNIMRDVNGYFKLVDLDRAELLPG